MREEGPSGLSVSLAFSSAQERTSGLVFAGRKAMQEMTSAEAVVERSSGTGLTPKGSRTAPEEPKGKMAKACFCRLQLAGAAILTPPTI